MKEQKVVHLQAARYQWPEENLARADIAQGPRLGVFRNLLQMAGQGQKPIIRTTLEIGRPSSDKTVPYIIAGWGRVASVLHWEALTPDERLQEYLYWYRSDAKGDGKETPARADLPVSFEQRQRITVETLTKFEEFSQEKTKIDPAAVVDAFRSEVTLPCIMFDLSKAVAKRNAMSDLIDRDAHCIADCLDYYADTILLPGVTKASIAMDVRQTAAAITWYAKYHDAKVDKGLTPTMQRVFYLHNGQDRSNKDRLSFEKTMKLFKIGNRSNKTAKIKNEKGHGICEFSLDEQDIVLNSALAAVHKSAGHTGDAPDISTASDRDLGNIQFTDVRDACKVLRQPVAAVSVDGKPQEVDKTKPAPADQRPSHATLLAFVQAERFDGTPIEGAIKPMREFAYGHISPAQCADDLTQFRVDGKKRKALPDLPKTIGAKIERIVTPRADDEKKGETA